MQLRLLSVLTGLVFAGCATAPVVSNRAITATGQHIGEARGSGKEILKIGGTLERSNAKLKASSDKLGDDINLLQSILNSLRPKSK